MNFAEQYKTSLLDTIAKIDTGRVDEAITWFDEARAASPAYFCLRQRRQRFHRLSFCLRHRERREFQPAIALQIMALTDSLPTLTAYSNDVSYDCVFVEQLKNFAEPGDLVMAISGSGNSPNVLRAVEYANSIGCKTIALDGPRRRQAGSAGELNIQVPVPHMGRIEDAHMIICHMIAYRFMDC